jgi:hypothetical protein
MDTTKPKTPEKAPKIKYNVPITLWFVEKSQRETHGFVYKAIKKFKLDEKII